MFDFLPYYTPELIVIALVAYLIWLAMQKAKEPPHVEMKMLQICYTEGPATYALEFKIQPKLQASRDGTLAIYLDIEDVRKHVAEIDDWNEYWEGEPHRPVSVDGQPIQLQPNEWTGYDMKGYEPQHTTAGPVASDPSKQQDFFDSDEE